MAKPFVRTKKLPPTGAKCDMSTGVDYESKTPKIIHCKQLATVELKGGGTMFATFVCEDHANVLLSKKEKEDERK